MPHIFSKEQSVFIRENVVGRTSNELTAIVNQVFDTELSVDQIRAFKKNNKLRGGIDTRFQKGQAAHNKGKPGNGGWRSTQYKKGSTPHNYLPVGSERINTDGYVDIKIADPNKWKQKHLIVWEEANGPVPVDHVVLFGDGDKLNVVLDNLLLVTRQQLFILNRNKLIHIDIELTKTGCLVAELHQRINGLKKTAAQGRTNV